MATLLPEGKQSFTNSAGAPLAGGKVYTYDAGTSAPRATYSDAAGTIPNANPVTLDARGEATIFWSGSYKVILKDASDVTIWTVDGIVSTDPALTSFIASIAGSGGSNLVGFLQAGTGAVARTMQAKGRETVSVLDYGADPTGAVDSGAAFNRAITYLQQGLGGTVIVPRGTYLIATQILLDRSANVNLGRVSIRGEDEFGSRLVSTVSGSACIRVVNNDSPGVEGSASYQVIEKLTIIGPGATNAGSSGIWMVLSAFATLRDLDIQYFDYGVYTEDVDQFGAERVKCRFNRNGWFSRKAPVPVASSTQPNNFTMVGCHIGNNSLTGGTFVGGSNFAFFGGSIENNGGTGASGGYGLKFLNSGYEGGVGANLHGVYFESNNSVGDLVLEGTVAGTGISQIVHSVHGCSFNRTRNTDISPNCVVASFGIPVATYGLQKLVLSACGFKGYAGYTPNAGNKYLLFSLEPASKDNFYNIGCLFQSALEAPAFAQNVNRRQIALIQAANQAIPNAAYTKYLVNAQSDNLSWPYVPAVPGDVVIPEAGVYNISVMFNFVLGAGVRRALVKVQGNIVGVFESTVEFVSGSITRRLGAGDTVTVEAYQNSGAALNLLGAGTCFTNITISRVTD